MRILEWGIYLVVFCLPLYLIRFKIFTIPTNVLEVMIGMLFIAWAIGKVKSPANSAGRRQLKVKIKDLNLFIPIVLILIGVSVATIFSWDLRVSAGVWKSWFIVPVIFFIILITTIKKPNEIKKIFWAFVFSGFVIGIISLVYLIQGNLDVQARLQAIYNSPNYLAMYLAPALILSAGLLSIEKKRLFKILYLVSCILYLVILFFAKSLGAWLGIIIAVCFGLIIYLYKLKKKRLIFLIIILGILIILLLFLVKTSILPRGKSSFDARILIWQKAWQVFKMNSVVGIGPGTFEDYFPLYPKWGVPQPHNLYWAFLLQTGIIGFIGFIWLIVLFFKKGFELLKTQNLLSITIMSTMVYILIHGLVDTTYWKNDLSIIFWLVIALSNIISRFSYSQTLNSFLGAKGINQ